MGEQCISKVAVGVVLRMIQNVPEQGESTYKKEHCIEFYKLRIVSSYAAMMGV